MAITDGHIHRRTVLKTFAGVVGTVGGATIGCPVMSVRAASAAPPVEWTQTYNTENSVYLSDFIQTADGGYAMAGVVSSETDSKKNLLALRKTDANGEQQWVAVAPDSKQKTDQWSNEVVQTSDGAYLVIGSAEVENDEFGVQPTEIAEVAKISPDGDVQWLRMFPPSAEYDGAGEHPATVFYGGARAGTDGSVVVGGYTQTNDVNNSNASARTAWLMKLSADGSVVWEKRYDSGHSISNVFTRVNDEVLVFMRGYADNALLVDETGTIKQSLILQKDDKRGRSWEYIQTGDGGYAYMQSNIAHRDMTIGKLTAAGEHQWRQQYTLPPGIYIVGCNLVQTADGGYALGATVKPSSKFADDVILKMNARGEKQWEKLFAHQPPTPNISELRQTADGGYAALLGSHLVKLAPSDTPSTTTAPEPVTTTQPQTDIGTESPFIPATPTETTPSGKATTETPSTTGTTSLRKTTAAMETTSTTGPGFGVVAALSGCGLGVWRYLSDE